MRSTTLRVPATSRTMRCNNATDHLIVAMRVVLPPVRRLIQGERSAHHVDRSPLRVSASDVRSRRIIHSRCSLVSTRGRLRSTTMPHAPYTRPRRPMWTSHCLHARRDSAPRRARSAHHRVQCEMSVCRVVSPSGCIVASSVRFIASSRRFTCTVVLHRRISGARRLNAWSPRGHECGGSSIRRGRRRIRVIASPPGARQVRRARRRFLRVGKVAAPANSSIRRSRRPGRHRELHRELLSTEPRALSVELAGSGIAVARSHREFQRELQH
jgi:hypothetical protein